MSKGFKLVCLNCNSENVHIAEDIDYDLDEMPIVMGYYLKCDDCDNEDR